MEFKDNTNYVILTNNNDEFFLKELSMYRVIGKMNCDSLLNTLENFPSKTVVFNETLSYLSNNEILHVIKLLKMRNVCYIIITSNVEFTLYVDYIIVYNDDLEVLEGTRDKVLENEKLLKNIGFGLPFVVNLANNLRYYDVLDKIYYDMDSLLEALWN